MDQKATDANGRAVAVIGSETAVITDIWPALM